MCYLVKFIQKISVGLHVTIRPQKQVNYNRKGIYRDLHSPGVGRRSIVEATVPVHKDMKYRSTTITEKLFTITEISRR